MQTSRITQIERLSGRTPSTTLHLHREGNLDFFFSFLLCSFYDDVDAAELKTSAGHEMNTK